MLIRILSQYQFPFGSTLPTRSWSDASRAYRYGFNGKEKDSETANDYYDFGARIYDGRLGRWLSLDRMLNNKAFASPYSCSKNCPIIYVDMGGDDEYYYITIDDKRTGQTTTQCMKKSDEYDKVEHYNWNNELTYDFYHIFIPVTITIDENGKKTSSIGASYRGMEKVYSRHPIVQWFPYNSATDGEEGDGEKLKRSGIKCTSENGGTSPTKTVVDKPGESNNMELLLQSFGGAKNPKVVELSEKIKSMLEKADELAKIEAAKKQANKINSTCKTHTCSNPNCNFNDPQKMKKAYEDYANYGIIPEEKTNNPKGSVSHDRNGKDEIEVPCQD